MRELSQEQFDSLMKGSAEGGLGVRRWTREQLAAALSDVGLVPLEWHGFTFYRPGAVAAAVEMEGTGPALLYRGSMPDSHLVDNPISQLFVCCRRKQTRL